MKSLPKRFFCVLLCCFLGHGAAAAQSEPELMQLLAPVALYPDDLLSQILTASTHPAEVVIAENWRASSTNATLAGENLSAALQDHDWDASVKSLVYFPEVLQNMSGNYGWMQQLGNAYLSERSAVDDMIQKLRRRALNSGTLKSGGRATVRVEGDEIVIEPVETGKIFVPVYDPQVVYAPWPYPGNPPVVFLPPPGTVIGPAYDTGISYGPGFIVILPFERKEHRFERERHHGANHRREEEGRENPHREFKERPAPGTIVRPLPSPIVGPLPSPIVRPLPSPIVRPLPSPIVRPFPNRAKDPAGAPDAGKPLVH